ncbi:glycine N-acyltransferase-like protein isoform X2 [Sinocyclocheilus anshuiensis]|uniref:glycine N-acyltransferase-like protein isoform X2 n=1 Tax=Sinocyclocheilus anshuiensis TaxID=1608454 RepID=UPI0007B9AA8A|nr:PREDICTED: glycine N-acyltransferase-like protein isoform X2 [Sinocyclocheilus anshuiensis]
MRQLTTEDLKTLEVDLKNYFPQSLQVYGCIVQLNRNGQRADPVCVLADQWPEFRVLLIKPEFREKGDLFKDMTVFSKNDIYLRDLLAHSDVIDWKMFICLAAELHHEKMLEFVAINRGVPMKKESVCYMLVLRDPSKLSHVDSSSLKLSSLNDQPVAWILNDASSALGMLYTLPEHRGKGYAKALVAVMSKTLHSQDYPVYCFIEEENHLSYSLFTSLGFTEEPDYRAAWFVFNDL